MQWFQSSLRKNNIELSHYKDGVQNCGDSTDFQMRKKFFSIIDKIVARIKLHRGNDQKLLHMINALAWNYHTEDLEHLEAYSVFQLLHQGDGTEYHPLRRARFEPGVTAGVDPSRDIYDGDQIMLGHRVELVTNIIACSVLNSMSQNTSDMSESLAGAGASLIE